MIKGESRLERASNQVVIIDAFIIDELDKLTDTSNEDASARLPAPNYEAEAEPPKEENTTRVIIIER